MSMTSPNVHLPTTVTEIRQIATDQVISFTIRSIAEPTIGQGFGRDTDQLRAFADGFLLLSAFTGRGFTRSVPNR